MIRSLRYPWLSAAACAATVFCALWRDFCIEDGLFGWARVLLYLTFLLLGVCLLLLSCRFFADERGVGVGFLMRVRRTNWDDLAALGKLCCNSRRPYLYGLYRGQNDFLVMLHRAPQCGDWGFVVPLNKRLARAVTAYCPYDVDLSPIEPERSDVPLRLLWSHAALYLLAMVPTTLMALGTGMLLLTRGAQQTNALFAFGDTVAALLLFFSALLLAHRTLVAVQTCPRINESGVSAGIALYLPWKDVRTGYVKRHAQLSGLFLLSERVDVLCRRSAPPVRCLSMPDTSTLLLAYLTYCPHADKQKYA